MVGESLKNEVMDSLESELSKDAGYDALILESKVDNAVKEVMRARRYPASYTDERKESDLSDYWSNIRNIALYDYNMSGAEFQQSHNENGIQRTFGERKKLFSGILPIAKF